MWRAFSSVRINNDAAIRAKWNLMGYYGGLWTRESFGAHDRSRWSKILMCFNSSLHMFRPSDVHLLIIMMFDIPTGSLWWFDVYDSLQPNDKNHICLDTRESFSNKTLLTAASGEVIMRRFSLLCGMIMDSVFCLSSIQRLEHLLTTESKLTPMLVLESNETAALILAETRPY